MPLSTTMRFRQFGRQWVLRFVKTRLWQNLKRAVPLSARLKIHALLARSIRNDFRFPQAHGWDEARLHRVEEPTVPAPRMSSRSIGVNLYGYLSKWMGLGECARLFAKAIIAGGWPTTLHDVKLGALHDKRDRTLEAHLASSDVFEYDLIFVNPDFWHELPPRRTHDHYVIAYWFWELESFPEKWHAAIDGVDEIMVASTFVESAISAITHKPVTKIPVPVVPMPDSGLQRRHFGLRDDDFVFLTMFDFNSSVARKNPFATIEAFKQAFPRGDEKACLLLKSSNGEHCTAQLMHLVEAAARDQRIIIRDDLIDRADLQALQRCCDVYLSLHRSEGFGLVMAETMLMGKPVIATAYSGNLEFMNADNSCLVDYDLIRVEPGEYPLADGQYWAAPHVHHAAEHMRALFGDRGLCQRLGAQASADMANHHAPAKCLASLQERLQAIDSTRRVLAEASDGHHDHGATLIREPRPSLPGVTPAIQEFN